MAQGKRLGFIGAGQMARALAVGVVRAGLYAGEEISAIDPSPAAIEQFLAKVPGAHSATDHHRLAQQSDVLLLAVKPQHAARALAQLPRGQDPPPLLISIVAGMPLDRLCQGCGNRRVVRVMPNTPALVGRGAAGIASADGVSGQDRALVESIFQAVGFAVPLPESLLDAVTGLSGSGPAFVYEFVDALADAGVRAGLPRAIALQLAVHTVRGAAEMILQTGEHPGVLKDQVASPGGTTIAGLHQLHRGGLRGLVMDAVLAAAERSRELGSPPNVDGS
jgi:pyrroline-5-carboxylate reductase